MTLEINQEKDQVVIRMPLSSARHDGKDSKAVSIAGGQQSLKAMLDGREEVFLVRALVDYHRRRESAGT